MCLQLFLRTLINRVDLLYHVGYIELESWDTLLETTSGIYRDDLKRASNHFIDSEEAKLFVDAAKEARVPGDSDWFGGCTADMHCVSHSSLSTK